MSCAELSCRDMASYHRHRPEAQAEAAAPYSSTACDYPAATPCRCCCYLQHHAWRYQGTAFCAVMCYTYQWIR
jgi:hypothetical protein